MYLISKGALRPARKQYNPLNSDFEVYLETNSTLEPCLEDDNTSAIPTIQFNFKPILSLEQCATGTMADVVGVVLSCDAAVTIQRRDGTDTQKRTVSIKDDSNASIELTLWGSYVQDPGAQLEADLQQGRHPVVAIKAARVGDYQGKTLGTISSTTLLVDPDIPEAGRLRNWYDRMGGANSQTVAAEHRPKRQEEQEGHLCPDQGRESRDVWQGGLRRGPRLDQVHQERGDFLPSVLPAEERPDMQQEGLSHGRGRRREGLVRDMPAAHPGEPQVDAPIPGL